MKDLKEKIIKKLKELDFEDMRYLISDINSYDDSLDWLEYQDNDDDFFNTYFGNNTIEAVRATQFGDYKYSDNYVKFNAYGNLDSANQWQIQQEYNDYIEDIAERIIELKNEATFHNDEINEILEIL